MSRTSIGSLLLLCFIALLVNLVRPTPSASSYLWTPAVKFTDTQNGARLGGMVWGRTDSTYIHYLVKECTQPDEFGCRGSEAIGWYVVVDTSLDWVSAWNNRHLLSDSTDFRMQDFHMAVDQADSVHVVHEIFGLAGFSRGSGWPNIGYQVKGRRSWDSDTADVATDTLNAGRTWPLTCIPRRDSTPRMFQDPRTGRLHLTYHYALTDTNASTCGSECDTVAFWNGYSWKEPGDPASGWSKETYITDLFTRVKDGAGCYDGAGAQRIIVDSLGVVHLWGRQTVLHSASPDSVIWHHVWGTPPSDSSKVLWEPGVDVFDTTIASYETPAGKTAADDDDEVTREIVEGDGSIFLTWKAAGSSPVYILKLPIDGAYSPVGPARELAPGGRVDDRLVQAGDGTWHYVYSTSPGAGIPAQIWHKYVTTGDDPYDATAATPGGSDGWSEPSMFTIDQGDTLGDAVRGEVLASGDSAWVTYTAPDSSGANQHWFRHGWPIADSVQAGSTMTWEGLVSLDGDFYVAPGGTLIVEPGTMVVAADSTDRLKAGKDTSRVEIVNRGLLLANGTSADPIEFRGTDTTATSPWYGLRMDLQGVEWTGYGYVGCVGPQSQIAHAKIRDAEHGINIENVIAPSLDSLKFANIGGSPPQHIHLDTTDVFLPRGEWIGTPDSAGSYVSSSPARWDLYGPTNVVATDTVSSAKDWDFGETGKVDLVVQGHLFTHGSTSAGDTVYFRPETQPSSGDGWGGLILDNAGFSGSVIEYADIGFADNPVFIFYPDSLTTLKNSRVHDFAGIGVWVDGSKGQGGVIQSNTVERGSGVLAEHGRTGIFVDGADALRVRDNKINLSGLDVGATSAALDMVLGKTKCQAPPGSMKHLTVDGNWILGPGTSGISGTHSGIKANWLCGSATRGITIVRNYLEGFNFAGIEFVETESVQADSNNVVDCLRGVDISRSDPAVTHAVGGFKANWWEVVDKTSGTEVVRTNSIQYTEFGPSSATLGDNGFKVADSSVSFMNETDSAADTLVAEDCYWYLDEDGSEHFLNTMQEWSTQIRKRLDPDSTQYDVWPVQSSDTNPTYYKMTAPPSVGRAVPGRGEGVVAEGSSRGGDPEETARLAQVVPPETYFSVPSRNPVRTAAVLELGVAQGMAGLYEIEVFAVTGRRVTVLAREGLGPGTYRFKWSGSDGSGSRVSSGVYFIRVQGPGFRNTQKVTLLR